MPRNSALATNTPSPSTTTPSHIAAEVAKRAIPEFSGGKENENALIAAPLALEVPKHGLQFLRTSAHLAK